MWHVVRDSCWKKRQGRKQRDVLLYVKKLTKYVELCYVTYGMLISCSWDLFWGEIRRVSWPSLDTDLLIKQLIKCFKTHGDIMENFSYPNFCWKGDIVECKQTRRLLECIKDNILMQMMCGQKLTGQICQICYLWIKKSNAIGQQQPLLQGPCDDVIKYPQENEEENKRNTDVGFKDQTFACSANS